jgi:UDP-glucose 4-epimerase
MNFLITGGAGFIGNSLVGRLSKNRKNKIFVIDLKKKINKLKKVKNVKYIEGDISNLKTFDKIKSRIDVVYHLAAQTSVQIGEERPELNFKSNIIGTYNFYLWAKNNRPKVCYFASSMGVYGNDCENKKENDICEPYSNYGISKLIGETFLKKLIEEKINYIILRLFNIYGPGQDLKNLKQGMISIYLAQALMGNTINVTGSLRRTRDFVYIDDLINIITSKKLIRNQIYNIGWGEPIKVKKVIELIQDNINKKLKIKVKKQSAGDIFNSFGNIQKLKKIKLQPKVILSEGIKKMIKKLK